MARQGRLEALRVAVAIAHTYVGDLRVVLTTPDQRHVMLHNRSGGSGDDLRFTYTPANTPALSQLAGIAVAGDWVLTVIDRAAIDVGVLESWRLELILAGADPCRADREPGLQIPDNDPAGVSDSVELAAAGTVGSVQVTVDITHSYIGDLRVTLRSPSGTRVVLHDRSGWGADNILTTYDAASAPALAGLAGEAIAGNWQLQVVDLAGRDLGKLNRWGLRVVPA
ncbi:MAG: proprotein convertase P-domain-containing protein [Parahaliea sp.]